MLNEGVRRVARGVLVKPEPGTDAIPVQGYLVQIFWKKS